MRPWQQFLTNLANLLKVKTILTLAIVFTFCFKTWQGVEITSEFVMIASAIVTYYFTRGESDKRHNRKGDLHDKTENMD